MRNSISKKIVAGLAALAMSAALSLSATPPTPSSVMADLAAASAAFMAAWAVSAAFMAAWAAGVADGAAEWAAGAADGAAAAGAADGETRAGAADGAAAGAVGVAAGAAADGVAAVGAAAGGGRRQLRPASRWRAPIPTGATTGMETGLATTTGTGTGMPTTTAALNLYEYTAAVVITSAAVG